SYPNLEILISDDGSNDGSPDYVRQMEKIDPRIRLLPGNPHPGLFTNINYLIKNCTGDAFAILGDDDLLSPEFVHDLVMPLVNLPHIGSAFCDHWIIDAKGHLLPKESEGNSRFYGRLDLPEGRVADPLTVAMRGAMCLGFALYRSAIFKNEGFDLKC